MKKIIFTLFTIFLTLVVFELFLKITKAEYVLINSSLYRAGDTIKEYLKEDFFEKLDDPELLYKPLSNKSIYCVKCVHPDETNFSKILFRTNEFGGRLVYNNPEEFKRTLVWIGGSFSFGVTTDEKRLIQSQLQQFFNDNSFSIKIIDLSGNGYVTTQKNARLKEYLKKNKKPDFIVIHNFNDGRRPFLYNDNDTSDYFTKNIDLVYENFPNFWNIKHHEQILGFSSLYRTVIALNFLFKTNKIKEICGEKCTGDQRSEIELSVLGKVIEQKGISNNEKALEEIYQLATTKTKVIEFSHLNRNCYNEELEYEVTRRDRNSIYFKFCKGRPKHPHYHEVHPPSYVYNWYSKKIIEIFKEQL